MREGILSLLVTSLVLTFTSTAFAASGHGPVEIPWFQITAQAVNVGILFAVLGFFLRKTIAAHFVQRRATYLDLVRKADSARDEAERNRTEISQRLHALETDAQRSVERANAEAEELRHRIVAEARELADKVKAETERSIQVELDKSRTQLRTELLSLAVEAARSSLKESVSGADKQKLQNEFVEKIQVVQ